MLDNDENGKSLGYDYSDPSRRYMKVNACKFEHACQLCGKPKHGWPNCDIYKEAAKKLKGNGQG